MRFASLRLFMALSFLGIACAQTSADVAYLLNGVQEIARGGSNGALIVFGEQAFPVVNAPSQAGSTEPLIAASRLGNGRLVVFGNTVILEHDLQVADTARFTTNLLRWTTGEKAAPRVGVYQIYGLAARLKDLGVDARDIALSDRASVDVVMLLARQLRAFEVAPLLDYIRGGGGLVAGANGVVAQRNPGQDFASEFPGNRLIAPAGLLWGRSPLSLGGPQAFRIESPPELSHAAKALAAFEANEAHKRTLSANELAQATTTLRRAAVDLPRNDTLLLPRLNRWTAPAIPPSAAFDKLTEAAKLWAYVKYFHTRVTMPGVDWDQAFMDAMPKILASRNDDYFADAVNAMLAPLHDPFTRAINAAKEKPDDRIVMTFRPAPLGVLVVGFASGSQQQARQAHEAVIRQLASAKALVFDYRGIRLGEPVGTFPIATIKRLHHGYVDQLGNTYPTYQSSWQIEKGKEPARSYLGGLRPVYLVNSASIIPDIAVSLQAAGECAIVSEDVITDAQTMMGSLMKTGNLQVWVRTREFDRPDGTYGLTANVVLNKNGDAALQAAIEFAQSRKWPPPQRDRFHRPPALFTEKVYAKPYPDTELRLLAAARIWGVFNYFHPYRYLYGEEWDAVLARFLPRMAAVRNTREYHLAVAEMVTHTHDSHCFVSSSELFNAWGRVAPPIEVRWIENQPVVTRVAGDETYDIRPGDVVMKIDGEPVKKRIDELSSSIAASTPQALYRDVMSKLLNRTSGSESMVTFRGADGASHDVSLGRLTGNPRDLYPSRSGEVYRLLTPRIGYADLDRLTNDQVDAMFDAFKGTDAIILDMRGYPHYTHWSIAPQLAKSVGLVNAQVRTNVVSADLRGDVQRHLVEQHIPTDPQTHEPDPVKVSTTPWIAPRNQTAKPRYRGKTILLIDERAQSQSEHAGMMYKTVGSVFIGTPTAGANGAVTAFMAPGGIDILFSGQDVRWPDGKQLQRMGLIPDIEAHPTIEGIRAGRDEILERAVAYVETGR